MAYTTADIAAVREAIASGALSIRDKDGKQITFRSQKELLELLALMEAEDGRTRRTVAAFSNGTVPHGR
jgi:hypothetical protein